MINNNSYCINIQKYGKDSIKIKEIHIKLRTTCLTQRKYHSIIWIRSWITHVWTISVNLLDDMINFCTAFVILVFVEMNSVFLISTPRMMISNFSLLLVQGVQLGQTKYDVPRSTGNSLEKNV